MPDRQPSIRNLTKLTLNIVLEGETTGKIVIDFWDNSQGRYESTRTDQEGTTTGTVRFYEWLESNDETWVYLTYDGQLLDMRVSLTEDCPPVPAAPKLHILESRSVLGRDVYHQRRRTQTIILMENQPQRTQRTQRIL